MKVGTASTATSRSQPRMEVKFFILFGPPALPRKNGGEREGNLDRAAVSLVAAEGHFRDPQENGRVLDLGQPLAEGPVSRGGRDLAGNQEVVADFGFSLGAERIHGNPGVLGRGGYEVIEPVVLR